MNFWIAQILGIFGAICIIISSQMKNKRKYLIFYIFAIVFFILNMFCLNAYAGVLNNFLTMIITIISIKFENRKIPRWLVFLFLIIVLFGNILTYENIFSLLPGIASIIFLIILLINDMKKIRILTVFLRLVWLIFDFCVNAYSTFVFDIISSVFAIFAVYKFNKQKEK